jgi:hypothetical protein
MPLDFVLVITVIALVFLGLAWCVLNLVRLVIVAVYRLFR